MVMNCEKCGKKLPFLTIFSNLCNECKKIIESELKIAEQKAEIEAREATSKLIDIGEKIISTKEITEEQKALLIKQDKSSALQIYSNIYNRFEADKELDGAEIKTLQIVQETLGLIDEDVRYDELLRPYIYAYAIKNNGKLPLVDFKIVGGNIILKKGEVVHFADKTVLMESKTINLG